MNRLKLYDLSKEELLQVYPEILNHPLFHTYTRYILEDEYPQIYVSEIDHPKVVVILTPPAYMLYGDVTDFDVTDFLENIPNNYYFIAHHESWAIKLKEFFGRHLHVYPRTLFDSSSVTYESIQQFKKELPEDVSIKLITKEETDNIDMLIGDLIHPYFQHHDFFKHGFGYGLFEDHKMIGFCATNFPLFTEEAEVYVRVDFNSDPKHRGQGFATQLSVCFLEECFGRNLTPIWDSANEVSENLAKKLGFVPKIKWEMYHLFEK